jgi:hypothetical protein
MMQKSTEGRWRAISLLVRVGFALVSIAATGCHRNSLKEEMRKSWSPEGVRFTAEANVSPDNADTVFVGIRATNRSNGYRSVTLSHPGKCGPSVAFATGRGKATRVWRLDYPPARLPEGVVEACLASAWMVHFAPGTSVHTFRAALPVHAILGDSLPPGLYRAVIGGDAQLRGGYVTPEIALR